MYLYTILNVKDARYQNKLWQNMYLVLIVKIILSELLHSITCLQNLHFMSIAIVRNYFPQWNGRVRQITSFYIIAKAQLINTEYVLCVAA